MGIVANSRAEVRWLQRQTVPLGGWYNLYSDGGAGGGIDYGTPVNARPIPAWPDGEGKRGWGLGRWGCGAWGHGEGGVGWGYGPWGLGPWGFGIGMMSHVTGLLADGTYTLAAVPFDPAGNADTPASQTAEVSLAGTPRPPGVPTAAAYDGETGILTLSWALSPDDEG